MVRQKVTLDERSSCNPPIPTERACGRTRVVHAGSCSFTSALWKWNNKIKLVEAQCGSSEQLEMPHMCDHKTNHKGQFFFWNWDLLSSESWMDKISIDVWLLWKDNIWLRYNYFKIWIEVQKKNIEKIAFKVVQTKFLAMRITNQKLSFDIFMVGNLQNIFMEHDLYLISQQFLA